MKQILKQHSSPHVTWSGFRNRVMEISMVLILWNFSLCLPSAQAEYVASFSSDYREDEKAAVYFTLAYLNDILQTSDTVTIECDKEIYEDKILATAGGNKIHLNSNSDFYTGPATQLVCLNEVADGLHNITSTLIHEMSHNAGLYSYISASQGATKITVEYYHSYVPLTIKQYSNYDQHLYYGDEHILAEINPIITSYTVAYNNSEGQGTGVFTFHGINSSKVYNDGGPVTQYLQVENGQSGPNYYGFQPGSSLAHPYTPHGQMNALDDYYNRPFYSEVELAMLMDIGEAGCKNIDLKKHFGQSYYQTHGAITNTNGFDSDAIYGVGLHVVGKDNQVTQAANISALGAYATGIYSEGKSNSIIINPGVTVAATGYGGAGVIFTYYSADSLTNMGTIMARNGYGVFVAPSLKTLNNTGSILADTFAIYVNGKIKECNFMGKSIISGDIKTSETGEIINMNFGNIANADGTRGVGADSEFNGLVNGNILAQEAQMTVYGGKLKVIGGIDVTSIEIGKSSQAQVTLNGEVKARYFSVGSVGMDTTIVDGNGTGSIIISEDPEALSGFYNNAVVMNFTKISSKNVNNSAKMINVTEIQSEKFLNTGSLTVGEAGSVGIMNVKGTMTNNFSILNVDANLQALPVSGTTADLITVTELKDEEGSDTKVLAEGKVIINGGQVNVNELHSTGSKYYRAGRNHNIIETQDGVIVNYEMEANEIGYDIPLFKPVIGYDEKNVWVGLQRDFLYGPAGKTFNQREFGYYIDEIGKTPNPDGDLFTVLLQLDGLNASKKTGIVSDRALLALDEMSGAVYGTVTSMANQHATMINNALAKHLRDWSPCSVTSNGWNVWAEAYGMSGSAEHDENAHGYNYSVAGTLVGIDHGIAYDGHFGGYFAVGATNSSIKGLSESADSTDIFAGGYLNLKDSGIWYTTIFVGLGHSDYDVERHFSFIRRDNKSGFTSWQVNAYAERGVNLAFSDRCFLQPFAGIQFIGTDRESIQEEGADLLDLTVEGESMSSLRSMLGIKLGTSNCATGKKLNGEVSAAWMHEYADAVSMVSAQMSNPGGTYFESSPTYVIRGHNDGRDWLVAGAGLNYAFTENVKVFGGYDCMVNGIGALHMGNLGLELRW